MNKSILHNFIFLFCATSLLFSQSNQLIWSDEFDGENMDQLILKDGFIKPLFPMDTVGGMERFNTIRTVLKMLISVMEL